MKTKTGSIHFIWSFFTAAAMALALTACGGGGGNASTTNPAASSSVTGVAASSSGAISGATVTLKDTSGKSATGTTSSSGNYTINTQGLTPPFLLSVTSNGQTLFGYADQLNSVANLNQFSTAVLNAYYLTKGSTTAQTFSGNLSTSSIPTISQIAGLTNPVVRAIQPFLVSANVPHPTSFNPLSSSFTFSSSTGFGQVLSNATISNTGAGFTVASTTATGPTTSFSFTSGASGVPATTASDFVASQAVTTTPGSATTTLTSVMDMCSSQGTPVPGTNGLYDCTKSITISPNPINIAAGALVAMGDYLLFPSNLNPSVDILDIYGYHASIPAGASYLNWTSSNSAIISLSPPSTLYWPTLTALNIGTSLVSLTDTINNVSAQVAVNGIIPILTPSQIVVAPPLPYGGSNAKKVQLTDSSGNKVATPAGLTVTTSDPAVATARFDSWGDITVQGVAPSGMTMLNVTGTFGNAGQKTISSLICAQSWAPTIITGTYNAPVLISFPIPPLTTPDTGTFSGTLSAVNSPICGFGWYISSASLNSSIYGNHYSAPTISAYPPLLPVDFYGHVAPTSTVGTTVLPTVFSFGLQAAGFTPGAASVDVAQCTNVVWTTGPMAGLTGISSTGTGTFYEYYNAANVGASTTYQGTCTVTIE